MILIESDGRLIVVHRSEPDGGQSVSFCLRVQTRDGGGKDDRGTGTPTVG